MRTNATMTYPRSRIRSSGQCNKCLGHPGDMKESGHIKLQDTADNSIELLKWTCNKCGYTMFFDLAVARNTPYQNAEFEEVLPD